MGRCLIHESWIKSIYLVELGFLTDLVVVVGFKANFWWHLGTITNTGMVPINPLHKFSVFLAISEGHRWVSLDSKLCSLCIKLPIQLAFQYRAGQLELADNSAWCQAPSFQTAMPRFFSGKPSGLNSVQKSTWELLVEVHSSLSMRSPQFTDPNCWGFLVQSFFQFSVPRELLVVHTGYSLGQDTGTFFFHIVLCTFLFILFCADKG